MTLIDSFLILMKEQLSQFCLMFIGLYIAIVLITTYFGYSGLGKKQKTTYSVLKQPLFLFGGLWMLVLLALTYFFTKKEPNFSELEVSLFDLQMFLLLYLAILVICLTTGILVIKQIFAQKINSAIRKGDDGWLKDKFSTKFTKESFLNTLTRSQFNLSFQLFIFGISLLIVGIISDLGIWLKIVVPILCLLPLLIVIVLYILNTPEEDQGINAKQFMEKYQIQFALIWLGIYVALFLLAYFLGYMLLVTDGEATEIISKESWAFFSFLASIGVSLLIYMGIWGSANKRRVSKSKRAKLKSLSKPMVKGYDRNDLEKYL